MINKQNQVVKKDRSEPTPETRTKLHHDFIRELSPELQAAAYRIEEGYRLTTGKLMIKTNRFERRDRAHSDEWPKEQKANWRKYLEWTKEVRQRGGNLNILIAIIVDGVHPVELAWRRKLDQDLVIETIWEYLTVYNNLPEPTFEE